MYHIYVAYKTVGLSDSRLDPIFWYDIFWHPIASPRRHMDMICVGFISDEALKYILFKVLQTT